MPLLLQLDHYSHFKVVGSIVLWNTVYIQQPVEYLRKNDKSFNDDLIKHFSILILFDNLFD